MILRCPKRGDGPAMNAAIMESLADIQRWLPWAATVPTVEESEVNVQETEFKFMARDSFEYLMFLPDSKNCIGRVGFVKVDWRLSSFEIGYWIRQSYGGQGYMTEAVQTLTDYAFDHLAATRVVIRCHALNERSAAVAQRAGFIHEGTLRSVFRDPFNNTLADLMIFAMVEKDRGIKV
ncbi:MAG: GNAT family N-acetyltransferase [Chloroflexota bacterium]